MGLVRLLLYPVITFGLLAFLVGASARADDLPAQAPAAPVAVLPQPTAFDVDANWLDGGQTVSVAHVQRLVALAHRDPEAAAVLRDAERVLGVQTTDQLTAFISICMATNENGEKVPAQTNRNGFSQWGHAYGSSQRYFLGKTTGELLGETHPDHRAAVAHSLRPNEVISNYEDHPDYVIVDTTARDGICINYDFSIAEAFNTFIHELTHIARMSVGADDQTFLDQYANREDYVQKKLVETGGEFDANYQDRRALIRMYHSRDKLSPAIRDAFDDQGNLLDRQKFIDYLLTDLRYRQTIGEQYDQKVVQLHNNVAERERDLYRLRRSRVEDNNANLWSREITSAASASVDRIDRELATEHELAARYDARMADEHIRTRPQ